MPSRIHVFPSGRKIALVARSQLRASPSAKRCVRSRKKGPVPPATPNQWDNSNGEKVSYQCYCNGPPYPDPLGDCYYECAIHGSSNWTGNSGTEFIANADAVAARYLQLSGGDNGLSDSDMMPEWLAGIVGPNGPRRILDWMVIPAAAGSAQWQQFMYACGGLVWTCSLCDEWLESDEPGDVWDAGDPDPEAGHAMFLTGRHSPTGNTDARTWGITPPIQVTDAGFASADSEFIALFSADQFSPTTGACVFSGMTWEDKRQWWMSAGGKDVGPSPFTPTPPAPPTPPTPTPPTPVVGWSGALTFTDGALTSASSAPTPTPTPDPTPTVPTVPPYLSPSANWPGVLVDLAEIAAAIAAGNYAQLGTALGQLLNDLDANPTTGQFATASSALQRKVTATRATKPKPKG